MTKWWKVTKPLRASPGGTRITIIPVGEMIEEAADLEDGMVRIFWSGAGEERLGALTVSRDDLESNCEPIEENK